MIHLTNLELEIPLGTFRDVVAVSAENSNVSIIDKNGWENMISLSPVFKEGWCPLDIEGEFGDADMGQGGGYLPGLRLQDVTHISVDVGEHDPDWDFHLRTLKIRTAPGITLTWELYCNGGYDA